MQKKKVVIIGGGAAGFFCAINIAQMNKDIEITIVEKQNKVLQKVKVSGGGRCNVTHHCFEIADLIKKYPRGTQFLKKAFHHFNTAHTIQWFKQRGVSLKVEADGRMFPSTNSSETIIQCFLNEVSQHRIQLKLSTEVIALHPKPNQIIVQTNHGKIDANKVVVACGGYPKAEQFKWLAALGIKIIDPVPSLFTFNIKDQALRALMGLSVGNGKVKIQGEKLAADGPILITHWGLSGPAILKLSAWGARLLSQKKYQFKILVNWLGNQNEQALRSQWQTIRTTMGNQLMNSKNPFQLPQRLWEYLLVLAEVSKNTTWSNLSSANQNKLIQL